MAAQGGLHARQPNPGRSPVGLQHALLLQGRHTREPADRFVEADRLSAVIRIGQQLAKFFTQLEQQPVKL